MKVLFVYINPTGRTAVPPNLSILMGHLKSQRPAYEIALFDTSFYKFDFGKPVVPHAWTTGYFVPVKKKIELPRLETNVNEDLLKKVETFKPDLIATGYYSNQRVIVRDLMAPVKKAFPHIPVIAGGCHPSFEPEESIVEPFLDMICIGEGEHLLVELCDRINAKKDYSDVRGLWIKKDGKVIRNPMGDLIDLDTLGFPDWDTFDPAHIYQPFHSGYFRVGMVEFGRGCPYRCTYCANGKYLDLYQDNKRGYFRHRKPKLFVPWLKHLKEKYELEMIYFQDGTFLTMPDSVLEELSFLYEEHINLPCILLTTVHTINEKRLKCLKRMKCLYVNLGIEEGNPEFREKYLKRKMTNQQIIEAFRLLRQYGIYSAAYNVLGFPHETRADIFQTIELNRQANPDSVYPQVFYPIEGSELRDWCVKEGFFDPSLDSLYTQILGVGLVSILKGLKMTREEIHSLLKTFNLYVRAPKALYPLIRLLEKDTPLSRLIITQWAKYYWAREPRFSTKEDLYYRSSN